MIVYLGVALLIGLAVAIGMVDRQARNSAWRRIAAARRNHHHREQALRLLDQPAMCRLSDQPALRRVVGTSPFASDHRDVDAVGGSPR